VLCYNVGCGKEFKESENTATSCQFHPGTPYFHDAYKGWTCCRKSTDFTEFLNMKGCAYSFHSNVKPPEPEKKKQEEVTTAEVIEVCRPKYEPMERPLPNSPMSILKTTLSESLRKQTYGESQLVGDTTSAEVPEVKAGVTQCVNKGCTTRYEGPETDAEICKFHPGVPIFHEGLKFWSCCQKRTTDFDTFMKQEGCQTGSHLWIKPKEHSNSGGSVIMNCRHDWHQDGSYVEVVVYGGGKKFDPTKSVVRANGVTLSVELFFPEENGFFKQNWILVGIISPEESSVLMTPMKIEIKMKKAEPVKWSSLDIPQGKGDRIINAENEGEESKNVGVDALDLSDL